MRLCFDIYHTSQLPWKTGTTQVKAPPPPMISEVVLSYTHHKPTALEKGDHTGEEITKATGLGVRSSTRTIPLENGDQCFFSNVKKSLPSVKIFG